MMYQDGPHNTTNNDILRRLFADLAAAYRAEVVPEDVPADDLSLLQFYTDVKPGSQRMVNEVYRRLTATPPDPEA
jgi:hypothetical protein